MARSLKSIRGMHDVLPEESPRWQYLESTIRRLMSGYGYSEIRTPIVESTDLFCRSIGEVTDIVEKEMYTFDDRNGDSLTLRPEGTASCVRSGIEHGLLHNQIQRLWYTGPMFRHERPQKGRYRQFYQFGVEAFGMDGADIDAELICISARLWKELGIEDVRLELNSLGTREAREDYRKLLVSYFEENKHLLDEDSLRRLDSNPLRILDTKNPAMRELVDAAPSLLDSLDVESREHFDRLKTILDSIGIEYTVNPKLVRGLDYYSRTVFEWITGSLGAQGTICAGGRYDGLVEQLGGKPTTASGFAIGLERVLELFEPTDGMIEDAPDVFVITQGHAATSRAMAEIEKMRTRCPALKIVFNCGDASLKSQMKRADKSGARYAIIIGDDELAEDMATLKVLRGEGGQRSVPLTGIEQELD